MKAKAYTKASEKKENNGMKNDETYQERDRFEDYRISEKERRMETKKPIIKEANQNEPEPVKTDVYVNQNLMDVLNRAYAKAAATSQKRQKPKKGKSKDYDLER